jgi:hypothetical protein
MLISLESDSLRLVSALLVAKRWKKTHEGRKLCSVQPTRMFVAVLLVLVLSHTCWVFAYATLYLIFYIGLGLKMLCLTYWYQLWYNTILTLIKKIPLVFHVDQGTAYKHSTMSRLRGIQLLIKKTLIPPPHERCYSVLSRGRDATRESSPPPFRDASLGGARSRT